MRRGIIPLGAAAALLLADTLLWAAAERVLAARTSAFQADAQAHGWLLTAGDRHVGGWPIAATLSIDRAGLSGGTRRLPGGLSWSADRIVLGISLAHPLTLSVAAEGQQFLRLSEAPDIGFTAALLVARVPLLGGPQAGTQLTAEGVTGGVAGSGNPQDVQIQKLSLRLRQEDEAPDPGGKASGETIWLEWRARGIGLPDIGRWPLGATVATAGAKLELSAPRSQHGSGKTAGPEAFSLAQWRDGGGRLAIRDAKLRWGPLAVAATADLRLDDRLQPAGFGTADTAGIGPALDAAAEAGLITPGVALTSKAILSVMARVPGPDGDSAIRLPFLLRDNTLSVGQIPIVRLRDIGWPGGNAASVFQDGSRP